MAMPPLAYSLAALLAALLVLVTRRLASAGNKQQQQQPLPPGPKGLPLVGNVADLPPKGALEWQHWLKHKDLYGPVSSVTVLGQTIILLHDLEAALEMLDKRGAKYASRSRMVFAGELCGYNERMPFFKYNDAFRRQRKLAAGQLGTRAAIHKFHAAMELEARRLLLRTLQRPDDVVAHLQASSASLMLNTLYGYAPAPHRPDGLVRLINKVMAEFSAAVVVGAWAVDLVPGLRHLPGWLPGAGFQATARQWRRDSDEAMNVPADFVVAQMARAAARPSYVARLLAADPAPPPADRRHIRQSAAALYAGGADSTAAALAFFVLAMAAFPHVQVAARAELDRVVGPASLPGLPHRDRLPYVEAVVKETLRWQPVAPLAPPHMADEDDAFRGFRIPRGAIVLANIKCFSMDPAVYPDPDAFRPERFLGPNPAPSPYNFVFGFGRRLCPGRLLADASMFLTIAQCLAVFDFGRAVDEATGHEMPPVVGTTAGLIARPLPFKCRIVPRSEKHRDLIRQVEVDHPWEEGDDQWLQGLSDP